MENLEIDANLMSFLMKWFKMNSLFFNEDKTKFMPIQKRMQSCYNFNILANGRKQGEENVLNYVFRNLPWQKTQLWNARK